MKKVVLFLQIAAFLLFFPNMQDGAMSEVKSFSPKSIHSAYKNKKTYVIQSFSQSPDETINITLKVVDSKVSGGVYDQLISFTPEIEGIGFSLYVFAQSEFQATNETDQQQIWISMETIDPSAADSVAAEIGANEFSKYYYSFLLGVMFTNWQPDLGFVRIISKKKNSFKFIFYVKE